MLFSQDLSGRHKYRLESGFAGPKHGDKGHQCFTGSHLSLKKGLNRFKPSVFGWELARTTLKLGLLIALFWGPTTAWINRLGEPLGLGEALDFLGSQVWTLAIRAAGLALVIAAATFLTKALLHRHPAPRSSRMIQFRPSTMRRK